MMASFEKWISEHALVILISILGLAVVLVGVVVCNYPFQFSGFPSQEKEAIASWGQLGDFFGGTLNPIFGFLSIIALLTALVIQGRELKISSEELKKSSEALDAQNRAIAHQSFEQTFFSWLKTYRESVNAIEYHSQGNVFGGRKAMYLWWDFELDARSVICSFSELQDTTATMPWENYFEEIARDYPEGVTDLALKKWNSVYLENEYQLDSLFRNLYRLIMWIHSQHKDRVSDAQKWFYISIVRAQLSWIEMVCLFYNGYTDRGSKFKSLVEKYALFDNLNFGSDLVIQHLKTHAPNENQYLESAYDSLLARKALGLPESTEDTLAMAVV